jgi:hypothetical protein
MSGCQEDVGIEPSEQLDFLPDGDVNGGSMGSSGLTSSICLRNNHHALPLLFRIQTTSPLQYRVRPSHGRIVPGDRVNVLVVRIGAPPPVHAASGPKGSLAHLPADKFLVKFGFLDGSHHASSEPSDDDFSKLVCPPMCVLISP